MRRNDDDAVMPGDPLVAALRETKCHLKRDSIEWWADQSDVPVSSVIRAMHCRTLCRWQWERLDRVRRFPSERLTRRPRSPNWGGNRYGTPAVVDSVTGVVVKPAVPYESAPLKLAANPVYKPAIVDKLTGAIVQERVQLRPKDNNK